MAADTPLDLHSADPPVWRVKVDETIYGPYTLGQMMSFVSEGRVANHTLVSRGDEYNFIEAPEFPPLKTALKVKSKGEIATSQEGEAGNFLIVAQMEGATRPVTSALNSVGRFAEAAPGIYILRSTVRIARIRALMDAVCGEKDRIVIVDATHGRLAWLGLGPETDTHIRSVWNADIGE